MRFRDVGGSSASTGSCSSGYNKAWDNIAISSLPVLGRNLIPLTRSTKGGARRLDSSTSHGSRSPVHKPKDERFQKPLTHPHRDLKSTIHDIFTKYLKPWTTVVDRPREADHPGMHTGGDKSETSNERVRSTKLNNTLACASCIFA